MTLRLFDTYERKVRPFVPLNAREVGIYACGPTVYNFVHIGNLRTFLFEDLLRRTLVANGHKVTHIMNITDVGHLSSDADTGEDKMEIGAKKTGMSAWELADLYTAAFQADCTKLNILPPTTWCRATEHIEEQIAFIKDLENKGYTYQTSDGIYFDSQQLDNYGHLARLNIEGLKAGARVAQGERRGVTDFALWKFSPKAEKRQMEWDSPWGLGFPGWHIECSAMAVKYLGDYFDIHCGGEDLIPIHHTNEIAQTEASRGTRLANFWMHGYFLQMDNAKMAKASGGFITLQQVLEKGYAPLVYRYFCFTAHYRSPMSFSWDNLDAAQSALQRLYQAAWSWGEPGEASETYLQRFAECLNDDLNMPRALAVLWELVRSEEPEPVKKATLLAWDDILALDIHAWRPDALDIPEAVSALVRQREAARQNQDWQEADKLREDIARLGFALEDGTGTTRLRRADTTQKG